MLKSIAEGCGNEQEVRHSVFRSFFQIGQQEKKEIKWKRHHPTEWRKIFVDKGFVPRTYKESLQLTCKNIKSDEVL